MDRESHVGRNRKEKEYYLKNIQNKKAKSTVDPEDIFDSTNKMEKPKIKEVADKRPYDLKADIWDKVSSNVFRSITIIASLLLSSGHVFLIFNQGEIKGVLSETKEELKNSKNEIKEEVIKIDNELKEIKKDISSNSSNISSLNAKTESINKDIDRLYSKKSQ